MENKPAPTNTVRVFVPIGKPAAAKAAPRATRVSPRALVIGLLDNHKHNTGKVLDRLQQRLGQRYEAARFVRVQKPEAGKPAPKNVIEALASECRAVINGIAD